MNLKKGIGIVIFLSYSLNIHAFSKEAYLERFLNYLKWDQILPETEERDFLLFIQEDKPLSQKLREKWLYQLGQKKQWALFNSYYKPSSDRHLQCLALLADYYQQNEPSLSLSNITPLWLSGESEPKGCKSLFQLFLKTNPLKEELLTQRLKLALEKSNLTLARSLLQQYPSTLRHSEQILMQVHQKPTRILSLVPNRLQKLFYLYGLKRLVSIEPNNALKHWNMAASTPLLSKKERQNVLAHIALHKALRHQDDAAEWFAKVLPSHYTELLLGWEIRNALKHQNWEEVERLILSSKEKESPIWTYWLARAYEARKKTENLALYQHLVRQRHYYGFLASLRLKQALHFEEEKPNQDLKTLQAYAPILTKIQDAYQHEEEGKASKLLNDFTLELPKEDKSALIYWVSNHLHWKAKAIHLSNTEELNNQLILRFPISYLNDIQQLTKHYGVAEAFIYAIIRQESGFREKVTSPAGARGLMQVLPATALAVSKKGRMAYYDKKQLLLPNMNLHLGVAYLSQLAQRFDHHPVIIAAAYNAGPRQVNVWLKKIPTDEMDIWIETLPWRETRDYLKNIIAFYAVYQHRLNQTPDLSPFLKPIKTKNLI